MDADYQHKVLVVDDDPQIAETIGRLLETQGLTVILTNNSESALQHINEAKRPFSLIISDQRSDGGPKAVGTEFLRQARKITPDSQRILLTACSDIDSIIHAVNRGAIQGYIRKPWDQNLLIKAIRQGIKQFERCLENDRLMELAKAQNSKLYELNCELMEKTKTRNSEHHTLKKDIEELEKAVSNFNVPNPASDNRLIEQILSTIKTDGNIDKKKMTQLMSKTIMVLYNHFYELGIRNGFEIPPPTGGPPC